MQPLCLVVVYTYQPSVGLKMLRVLDPANSRAGQHVQKIPVPAVARPILAHRALRCCGRDLFSLKTAREGAYEYAPAMEMF